MTILPLLFAPGDQKRLPGCFQNQFAGLKPTQNTQQSTSQATHVNSGESLLTAAS